MTQSLLAALPMYDFPWTAGANDALWRNIALRLRQRDIDAPLHLTRVRSVAELWRHPRLVFGQTCGYPYREQLKPRVSLIATPAYDFPGCASANHCAFIIASPGVQGRTLKSFAGARAACNAWDSNTGMNLFRAMLAPHAHGEAFFSAVILTGSHRESLRAVAQRSADIASIDCVSFAQIQSGEPDLAAAVEIITRTPMSPGLPFICSASLSEGERLAVRAALDEALLDASLAPALKSIGLIGVETYQDVVYDRIAELKNDAIALGYLELA